jgi:hypothetical protein
VTWDPHPEIENREKEGALATADYRAGVLSALAPGGGYQSSWGTLLLALGGMNRDAVPGMSINGHQVSV